ncbi:MAG TPA: OmpH family outer membrane protein [Phycisphaerae bacterium]|nr:OmpH family outer membrane protein [Phycisphaerae bacterium]
MKRSGMITLAVAVAAVLTAALATGWAQAPPPAAQPARVAVCDVGAVFDGYAKRDALNAQLEQKRTEATAVNDARTKKIEDLSKLLNQLKEGTREHEQRLEEFKKLSIEQAVWLKFEEGAFMAQHRRMMSQLYTEALDEVARVAQSAGYDLVLYKEGIDIESKTTPELYQKIAQRKVLYVSEKIDITQTVLDALNRRYRESSKQTP